MDDQIPITSPVDETADLAVRVFDQLISATAAPFTDDRQGGRILLGVNILSTSARPVAGFGAVSERSVIDSFGRVVDKAMAAAGFAAAPKKHPRDFSDREYSRSLIRSTVRKTGTAGTPTLDAVMIVARAAPETIRAAFAAGKERVRSFALAAYGETASSAVTPPPVPVPRK
jgi:hypothetical protein